MKMYTCRELRRLPPQTCGKKNRISIAAASSLSLPCTHLTCGCLWGEGALCCCCARQSSRVTNKADRMPLPFRGAHAPAVQGADAACVGGARGGRVSGAHEQQATVDGRLHGSCSRPVPCAIFAKCGCTVPATTHRCAHSSHFFIVIWFHLIFSAKVRGERKKLSKKFVPTF
jgi:hypothetical protein